MLNRTFSIILMCLNIVWFVASQVAVYFHAWQGFLGIALSIAFFALGLSSYCLSFVEDSNEETEDAFDDLPDVAEVADERPE